MNIKGECPDHINNCKYHAKIPMGEYCCEHPLFGGEPISSMPYCPLDKYTEIEGRWVWNEDLEKYIDHIKMRLEILDAAGGNVSVNSSELEYERQELHRIILDDVHEEYGSEWAKNFDQYVEERIKELMEKRKNV